MEGEALQAREEHQSSPKVQWHMRTYAEYSLGCTEGVAHVCVYKGWKRTQRTKMRDANVGRKALLSMHRVSSGLHHIPDDI